jgi:pantoate--beta-alanine ligase
MHLYVASGGQVDYVEIVNSHTLCPIETSAGQPVLIAVAALFGKVRLIDNVDFVSA